MAKGKFVIDVVGDHNIVENPDVTKNDIFGYQIFISHWKCVPPHPPFNLLNVTQADTIMTI